MRDSSRLNFAIGWSGILFGLLMGLVVGLWAFDGPFAAPDSMVDYASTPRRLLRLSHIAWIALGLINVVLALTATRHSPTASARISTPMRRALLSMNIGSVGLPMCLFIAAFVPAAKYAMALPASCVVYTAATMVLLEWSRTGSIAETKPQPIAQAPGVES